MLKQFWKRLKRKIKSFLKWLRGSKGPKIFPNLSKPKELEGRYVQVTWGVPNLGIIYLAYDMNNSGDKEAWDKMTSLGYLCLSIKPISEETYKRSLDDLISRSQP